MQWFYQFPEISSLKHIFVFHIMSVKQALLHSNCLMCCHSHFNLRIDENDFSDVSGDSDSKGEEGSESEMEGAAI